MELETVAGGGLLKTLERTSFGGLPYFLTDFTGPGSAGFSRDGVGETRIIELAAGEEIDAAEGSLLCADSRIAYDMVYVKGTHRSGRMVGFWMERLTGPRTIVFQGHGNFTTFQLKPGETLNVDHRALRFQDASVTVRAHNQPMGSGLMGHAMSFGALHVEGPGRIWLQTVDPSRHPPRRH